ncbi:MAG: formate hydrogenlyase subunit 4 [Mesoaciditoga sp.]|uniref:respiratory chain complex I subunit 1 family protein n=1 Tax=Athalassotoga sp. TaxID=2022597 RepID=UPI000CBF5C82|nr:MAG: formate hydrogenlyase subunit 4 [Mesoaciditoga sp.]PMP79783.1 MAG: formate hydrogenlyase subunit 4 [Mesoaciditoga sp.]HEU24086.1 formate hydrogenlyase subunit 4 [Mesoaciditoga lauensis]
MLVLLSIIQLFYVLTLAPLIVGIISRLEEKIESKEGPSIFQPYRDLIKLFRKENVVPEQSSPIFRIGPYISFALYMLLTLVLPIITAFPLQFGPVVDFIGGGLVFGAAGTIKKITSLDSRNNYSHLGTSRSASMSALSEPITVLIFIMLGVISQTNNPYVINNVLQTSTSWYLSLTHWFVAAAFFMVLLIETGKLPIESHSNAELGAIDQSMEMEYSGTDLAFFRWGSYVKQFLLMSVFLNVYTIPFWIPMKMNFEFIFIYMGIQLLKLIGLSIVFAFFEESVSKFRLFKNFDYISIAFSLAFLSFLAFYVSR